MLKTVRVAVFTASLALVGCTVIPTATPVKEDQGQNTCIVGCTVIPTETPVGFAEAVTAEWQCADFVDGGLPIVKVWVLDDYPNGKIEANGIMKEALYRQEGLGHRWDFDPNYAKDAYAASFVIEPDGTGKYFYFGSQDTAKPSELTTCIKTK